MKTLLFGILVLVGQIAVGGEVLRLKSETIVDIVEDGAVVGSRKVKAGTLISIVQAEQVAKDGKEVKKAEGPMSSEMPFKLFSSQRPKKGA